VNNNKREIVMPISRRAVLTATAGLAMARSAVAAPPEPAVLTPELIDAAKKEGKIAWYTADDLVLATRVSKAFETKYDMKVQLERSGAERIYQRIAQEYASNISECDVATTSDLGHTVSWNASGWLASFVPSETAHWGEKGIGPNGIYIVDKFTMVISGYNSRLVKAEDAPKSWNDLLDPKWKGKLVKAHPGYSGAITNETYALSHLLGWEFYENLAKQGVLQVQSATDPPMRCAQGERAVMADAAEVTSLRLIGEGAPLVLVYPTEGVPVVGVGSVLMQKSPRPNAARLFMHYLASSECQKINMDNGSRSFDTTLAEPAGWTPLAKIKLIFNDPADLAREAEEIKKRYSKIFGV
jgi:iron(III) transport system substrate-binding protein